MTTNPTPTRPEPTTPLPSYAPPPIGVKPDFITDAQWKMMTDGERAALRHSRSCPSTMPGHESDCTCGLKWRDIAVTEQQHYAAWRKRATEAEEELHVLKQHLTSEPAAPTPSWPWLFGRVMTALGNLSFALRNGNKWNEDYEREVSEAMDALSEIGKCAKEPSPAARLPVTQEQITTILEKHLHCSGGQFYVKGISEAVDEIIQTLQMAGQALASRKGNPTPKAVEQSPLPSVGLLQGSSVPAWLTRELEEIEKRHEAATKSGWYENASPMLRSQWSDRYGMKAHRDRATLLACIKSAASPKVTT